MASTVFDSEIFRDMFGAARMRAVFTDAALLERYVEVEVALAKAEAAAGVIPQDAAAAIAAKASAKGLDMARLKTETEVVGYPILPLVRQVAAQCGEAGRYLHWGATTQDIMDCATVLQVRAGLGLVEADIAAIRGSLAALCRKHRDTVMAGRTHLQQALPVTLGHKAAIWLAMFQRHAERLEELKPRVEVAQFGGAAGTLASLGSKGMEVRAGLARELALAEPDITWHVARDGFAEVVQYLALVTGSLAKIATDVMLLMTTEVAEVAEPFVSHRGGSSTMPQKRNPISSELMLAAHRLVRQSAGLMLDAMVADLERATGPWHLEWTALPEAFIAASGSLEQAKFMLAGLEVDEPRMRKNLALTGGLIVAEAAMMGLAPALGRNEAHDIVYAACRSALKNGTTLEAELLQAKAVTDTLSAEEIARLVEPSGYLGTAGEMVDRVLSREGKA
jgi:3-carboxy-cis,cis-muconate cycloisomerase